jgi:chromosomal replication initiation ATPase DnaA
MRDTDSQLRAARSPRDKEKHMDLRGQLPLPFVHQPTYAASDFIPARSNEAARTWLDRTAEWPENRLALWGEAGVGKTHLLSLWAGRERALRLQGPVLRDLPHFLSSGGIVLDDGDAVPDETILLHLLNAARDASLPVLLAARMPPARWAVGLPDLASRLRAVTAVSIDPPEEPLLRALLVRLLLDRQLGADLPVLDWLLLRLPRSAAALREAAARLDRASLAAHRKIDRRIAAQVVTEMGICLGD